jgi:hypothetical protein
MLKAFQTRRWFRLVAMIVVAAILFAAADAACACPNCKEGLAQNDPHGQSIAAGYYYSILFMLSMPFLIITTFGTFAYRSVKKAQAQRDAPSGQSGGA